MPSSEKKKSLIFDPDQDPEEQREVRQNYRALNRRVKEQQANPNDYTAEDILRGVQEADQLFDKVKQPQEATLDSHFLLIASNVGAQKARAMKSGSGTFDVDDFISQLVTYMGGGKGVADENIERHLDGDDAIDTPLDWAKIGRKAMAKSRRAPAIGFMLGPLSLEQKKRVIARRSKQEKSNEEARRPQELKEEDIQRSENETVKNVGQIEELLSEEGQINLFRFIINPDNFAQSVENMFYLSFLIRDGKVALETTEEGEPIIC
ncbi:hypothetical protein EST38_g4217 [Candolleomyces aberdarensis]|uniref:Non-structural maintenance of chromosomes element 4 n=1 Tax=Candolleomyces aberdarensis TaxID=2316362 RepID=A0A4V1Q4C9_9AGAR|nr:hypothetical protein EST38_g4217 [Candolleomyces aberdarensis]